MSTLREQIIAAAATVLNTGTPAGVPQCLRTMMQPNETSQLPALIVFPTREEVFDGGGKWGPLVKRSLSLRFVGFASGDPADGALDPLVAWLSTLNGQTFGGLVNSTIEAELNWQYDETNYQIAAVAVDFTIEYQTKRGDATQRQ